MSLLGQRDGRHAAIVVPDHVRHLGLLDGLDHLQAFGPFIASGFSHRIILPAWAAAMAISACELFGVQMSMTSMSLRSMQLPPVGLDRFVAPLLGERLDLVGAAGADGLEHRPIGEVEEVIDLAIGIGMGPAHEAVADHADVQGFAGHGKSRRR